MYLNIIISFTKTCFFFQQKELYFILTRTLFTFDHKSFVALALHVSAFTNGYETKVIHQEWGRVPYASRCNVGEDLVKHKFSRLMFCPISQLSLSWFRFIFLFEISRLFYGRTHTTNFLTRALIVHSNLHQSKILYSTSRIRSCWTTTQFLFKIRASWDRVGRVRKSQKVDVFDIADDVYSRFWFFTRFTKSFSFFILADFYDQNLWVRSKPINLPENHNKHRRMRFWYIRALTL